MNEIILKADKLRDSLDELNKELSSIVSQMKSLIVILEQERQALQMEVMMEETGLGRIDL